MSNKKEINVGGINGLGQALINTNSEDFKSLKVLIKKTYEGQEEQEIINNGLLSVRFQMEAYLTSSDVNDIIIAGEFIEKFLKIINVKKKQLSDYVGYEYSNLIALIKGRRKINSDLAIKLGQIFRVDPVIWLHIESKNELLKALQAKEKDSSRLTLAGLLKNTY